MKTLLIAALAAIFSFISFQVTAQTSSAQPLEDSATEEHFFIDVHQLEPGKVTFEAVKEAHAKDLQVQGKHHVSFRKFWVDESDGLVYCLSSARNAESVRETHAEAHGLLPAQIYQVSDGAAATFKRKKRLYLDVHYFGPGKVSAKDVEAAHAKDLAVQKKHHVKFINYWVDEEKGVVMCLSESKNSKCVIETHKEAHGLLPAKVMRVKEGK